MLVLSILFITVFGCLFHFTYGIFRRNKFVAIFSATNESTWEHIKIGLTGFLLWTAIDYSLYGEMNNYWVAKAASLLVFIIMIPVLFYSIMAVMKKHVVWVSILEFLVAIILGQMLFNGILLAGNCANWVFYLAFFVLFMILGAYIIFTWVQPKCELFRDPRNGKYGLSASEKNHKHAHGKKLKIEYIGEEEPSPKENTKKTKKKKNKKHYY